MHSLGYTQAVNRPTFIAGSLLDHVYVRQSLKANATIVNVYYSDLDAVNISLAL